LDETPHLVKLGFGGVVIFFPQYYLNANGGGIEFVQEFRVDAA
jgi:hypothetical protein